VGGGGVLLVPLCKPVAVLISDSNQHTHTAGHAWASLGAWTAWCPGFMHTWNCLTLELMITLWMRCACADLRSKERLSHDRGSSPNKHAANMPVKLLEGIVLVVSAILVIAGTATLWDARKAMTDEGILADTDEVRSRFNWDLIIFWLVWLAAAAALFIPKSFIFSSLAAGMGFVLSLQRNSAGTSPTGHASWSSINTCRIYVRAPPCCSCKLTNKTMFYWWRGRWWRGA
jgi:hypothetical protein